MEKDARDDNDAEARRPSRETIIEALERVAGGPARISLSDAEEGGGSAIVDPRSTEIGLLARSKGHYRVLGEIARGGMGSILRGHDADLGRDVAIKVLAPRLVANPAVVKRFVEEAQIGGQLQHPGVVPVYELGLMADDRPFFTMKLVRGRTLQALLDHRRRPDEELHRFLSTFESICQTMAYAHSKGVLHRDLKPANVMVGTFGEVQVVDWGLSKVLRRGGIDDERRARRHDMDSGAIETVRSGPGSGDADSVVGSIMGTPAYMPPEQACGEVDGLDERADVFALGAMLCEILTGKPPYIEEEGGRVVLQAAQGSVGRARERLAACGADERLIALCVECLEPVPSDRPRDAAELARSIQEYLADTEKRAREAQLVAAQERVKAAEERKARRLTVALALTIGFSLSALALGYLRAEAAHERRVEHLRERLDEAHGTALAEQADGRHAAALITARGALALLEGEAEDAGLRTRAETFLARAEEQAERARRREEREAADRRLLEGLEEIYLQHGLVEGRVLDAAFRRAFADYGLDLESDDLVPALETLEERGIGADVALALDDWARMKREMLGWGAHEAQALTALAADLDPDPLRVRLREALMEADRATLLQLAEDRELEHAPASTVWVLATALRDLGATQSVGSLLRRGTDWHADDFRLQVDQGLWHAAQARLDEAVAPLTTAHGLRPDNAFVVQILGEIQFQRGAFGAAARHLARAREARPELALPWTQGAAALSGQGRYEEALELLETAQARALLRPEQRTALLAARYLAGHGSAADFAAAADAQPEVTAAERVLAARALATHPDAARRDAARALAQLDRIDGPEGDDWLALHARSAALHALAQPEEVLELCQRLGPPEELRRDVGAESACLRALAAHASGDSTGARAWYARARALAASVFGDQPEGWSGAPLTRWLRAAQDALGD